MRFNSIHFVACCPNNRNNPIFVLASANVLNYKIKREEDMKKEYKDDCVV